MKSLYAGFYVIIYLSLTMSFLCGGIPAQEKMPDLKMLSRMKSNIFNKTDNVNYIPIILLWPLNPIVTYENKRVDFGLTKEVSFAFDLESMNRVGLEYSFIFRKERQNQIRTFFEHDIFLEAGEFMAVTMGIGGGYFTDFKKKGFFPQVTYNLIIPIVDRVGINLYFKLRHTFMTGREETDVTDLSTGMGLLILVF